MNGLADIARAKAQEDLITQVKRLQIEISKLQELANRLTDIVTTIVLANDITARMDEREEAGEGKD